MKILVVSPDQIELEMNSNQSLLEAIVENDISINHSCGGMGSCGTCLVVVEKGLENFAAPNELEAEIAEAKKFEKNERLACQNTPAGDATIKIPTESI